MALGQFFLNICTQTTCWLWITQNWDHDFERFCPTQNTYRQIPVNQQGLGLNNLDFIHFKELQSLEEDTWTGHMNIEERQYRNKLARPEFLRFQPFGVKDASGYAKWRICVHMKGNILCPVTEGRLSCLWWYSNYFQVPGVHSFVKLTVLCQYF